VSDETSKKHFSYWTQLTTQTNSKILRTCKKERESFRSLNTQGMRRGGTLGWLIYSGAKGWLAGQKGWPASAKISNFDAPPFSKSHGEDQKKWKEEKVEK
jgi:hypothetical protein